MKKSDRWKKTRDEELVRWEKALLKAEKDVVNDHFKGKVFKGEELEEVSEFTTLLQEVTFTLFFASRRLAMRLPSPMETIDERNSRTKWEAYLSVAKEILGKFPDSYLIKAISPVFKAEETAGSVISLAKEMSARFPFLYRFANTLQSYISNLDNGYKIWEKFGNENEPDERLIKAYASWKTWDDEAKHKNFWSSLEKNAIDGIEIYIEGPIQLTLILCEQFFFVLFRIFTIDRLSDLWSSKNSISTSILKNFVVGLIKDSKTKPIFLKLLKEAAKIYVNDLKEEERDNRRFISEQEKIRFLADFEDGKFCK